MTRYELWTKAAGGVLYLISKTALQTIVVILLAQWMGVI